MNHQQIKKHLIELVGQDEWNSIKPDILSIFDEAVESVIGGKCTINGEQPKTQLEVSYCVAKYVESAVPLYRGVVKGALESEFQPDVVTVNYREKSFTYYSNSL